MSMTDAMMFYATTLCVVTATHKDRRSGCVVGTFAVSAVTEPHVTFSLTRDSYTFELLEKSRQCAVNLLPAKAILLLRQFSSRSGRAIDKFQGVELLREDVPVLKEATGALICSVADIFPVVDRQQVICKVEEAMSVSPAAPYVYRIADSWPLL